MKIKKNETGFPIVYLILLYITIFGILVVNGWFEINRTEKGFYQLLQREATVLHQHFEKNILEALDTISSFEEGRGGTQEETIAEHLLEVAHRIDKRDQERALGSSDFQTLKAQFTLSSIEIYDPKGNLLRASSPPSHPKSFLQDLIDGKRTVVINFLGIPFERLDRFTIAVQRKMIPGIIALHLDKEQMRFLLRQLAIQRAISDIPLREGILFISVQDSYFRTLAHTDPSFLGKREEDPFLKNSLQQRKPISRIWTSPEGEEIFEVVKSLYLDDQPFGLVRIGYLSKEVSSLLQEIKKRVALSLLIFLLFGFLVITLIWMNQNRTLRRVKEMENRIQLAERISSLGHLAAGVAHEIRNPLNAISLGIQRLQREFSPQEESKKEEYLSFTSLISKEIRRVNEIIEQFLNLSRPFQLNRKEIGLNSLLENLVNLFKEEASSHQVHLQLEATELPSLPIDEEKLTQALINIMKNGIEAMENGGTLKITARSFRDRVEIVFADSGSGIAPDQMERIFDYYYTTKEKGVGLGLPMAHRIIEAHGGQLKVESQLGVGTRVTILLPTIKKEESKTIKATSLK